MRGYFLVAIILDHLAYFPNGLDWWSGRGGLFVSAAEGFFLISGIVLGIVRGSKLINKPFHFAASLLVKRSIQLYITAVVLMLLFTAIGWLCIDNPGVKAGIRPIDENVFDVIWGGLTFNYIYGWADYLRLYAIFILASPLAIWLLRKKLWYVVMAISIFVWGQFDNSHLETLELSQVYSWQLIFFTGLVIGFHLETIRNWWARLALSLRKLLITSVVSVAAITTVANYIIAYPPFDNFASHAVAIHTALGPYFLKEQLPIPRLILFALWFGAGFWLFTRFEGFIVRWLGWILLPFGTNSLYVYTVHAFVIFFAHLFIANETSSWPINLILSLAGVGIVWIALRYRFLMKVIPR
jgi:hypothetical protein